MYKGVGVIYFRSAALRRFAAKVCGCQESRDGLFTREGAKRGPLQQPRPQAQALISRFSQSLITAAGAERAALEK